jgi:hypothetical protein
LHVSIKCLTQTPSTIITPTSCSQGSHAVEAPALLLLLLSCSLLLHNVLVHHPQPLLLLPQPLPSLFMLPQNPLNINLVHQIHKVAVATADQGRRPLET